MNRVDLKLLTRTALTGALLTVLVALAQQLGWLEGLENWFYDSRARTCQFTTPPTTDKLVFLDINDAAIESIERWPWSREIWAEITDEVARAKAKAMAFDVMFVDEQSRAQPKRDETVSDINPDAEFARSLKGYPRVLLPMSLDIETLNEPPRAYVKMRQELENDLELSRDSVREKMLAGGIDKNAADETIAQFYGRAQHEAMFNRVGELLAQQALSFEGLRTLLLPHYERNVETPILRVLQEEYKRVLAMRTLVKFSRPVPPGLPPFPEAMRELQPINVLAEHAAETGFVNYRKSSDDVVRYMPLWVRYRDRIYPQIGFVLACMALDVEPRDVAIHRDRVVIPAARGRASIEIPVRTQWNPVRRIHEGMFMDIPMSGTWNWLNMFDAPAFKEPKAHMSINRVWTICDLRHRKLANVAQTVKAIPRFFQVAAPAEVKRFEKSPPAPDDMEGAITWIDRAIETGKGIGCYGEDGRFVPGVEKDFLDSAKNDKDRDDIQIFIDAAKILPILKEKMVLNDLDLKASRADLVRDLQGKSVLIGHTATSNTDMVTTPLHSRCPGVMLHGLVFNAITTGNFWRTAAPWVTILITLVLGLAVTAVVTWMHPLKALGVTAALGGAYWALNGLLLFDRWNLIVGMAGPMVALAVVFTGGTLAHFLLERAERARITRRFSNYVDPALVNYVLENPDKAHLAGEERELTVVFTDLAGFTTISEKLREQTVPLLNEYLGLMVPLIRQNQGYVNKFFGDGIMFFYGAPKQTADHAIQAIHTVLKMQEAMYTFNQTLRTRNLPELSARAGVTTGLMVVGDAGSDDASDYTVLGDNVNLASRLESANKATGTRIMISERTAELVGHLFLLRPIGRVRVVGKTQGVAVFEPLSLADTATAEQRKLAADCRRMVDIFAAADFKGCMTLVQQLQKEFGQTKLFSLYLELSEHYLIHPPLNGFDGQIVLTEK